MSPITLPFHELVASSDSRCGIWRIWVGVWSSFPPPIWNSENEHGWQVVHCASAAAIFIGWYLASITPSSLPTNMARMTAGTSTASDIRADRANVSGERPCRSCQADTASMISAPVTSEASSTWV